MKIVYEASNSIEAHMIENLLDREGIPSRIDGEFLQGGIGELQASGLVRIHVDEKDYVKASKVITEWENKQPNVKTPKQKTKKDTLLSSFLGFIAGSALILFLYNTPTTSDEYDNNNDGSTDEWFIYVNDRLTKVKTDRNFDGEIDLIHYYDLNEQAKSMRADDDFNGTLESIAIYKNGNIISFSADTNGDGFKDYKENHVNGVLDTIELIDSKTKSPIKIMKYNLNKIIYSKYDSNGDGVFDIEHYYDMFEEIKETKKI